MEHKIKIKSFYISISYVDVDGEDREIKTQVWDKDLEVAKAEIDRLGQKLMREGITTVEGNA